jgi:hypothetical protein
MKEWKVRQEIYHRLNPEHTDDLKNFDVEISENIIDNAILYFKVTDIGWIWPAKSYMVGICYALWLSKDFGGDPLDYLNDPELLYNNDSYFKTYNEDPETYDAILKNINRWEFDNSIGVVHQVRHYYDLEFGTQQ